MRHTLSTRTGWLTLLIFAALLALTSPSLKAAAELSAKVDRHKISLEETLQLTVKLNEQSHSDAPNFELLKEHFTILGQNRSSQFQNINGRYQSWTQWQISLAPKKTGQLLIPSLELNGAYSDAIAIEVTASSPTPKGQVSKLFLDTDIDIDNSSPYVQQQILFKVQLFTRVDLSDLQREELEIEGARVTEIAKHQYRRQLQGNNYVVAEFVYAVHPQTSGPLTIPALTYTVSVSSRSYDPYNRQSPIRRLRTQPVHLQIKAKPNNHNNDSWLPATDLRLQQEWSQAPNSFTVGEPITRTLTLTAEGLTAAQLPPLAKSHIDGLKQYPDQAKVEDQADQNGVTGTRTESIALVPSRSGKLTLPAIEVHWWDTQAQQTRTASLPATTINVSPAADNDIQLPATLSLEGSQQTLAPPTNTNSDQPLAQTNNSAIHWLWMTVTGLLALLSAWLGYQVWQLKRSLADTNHQTTSSPGHSTTNHNEKQAFKQLKKVCLQGNCADIRRALGVWAQAFWPNKNITNLESIEQLSGDSKLGELIQQLDRQLYASDKTSSWQAGDLIAAISYLRKQPVTDKCSSDLAPLYPQ